MLLKERRAAQYVRMSTDMQQYSIENQRDAIALYAARYGFTIVRSYEDAGRSGLRLDDREALKNLIADVRLGRADFSMILVYDVSRWGRFQDSDESAYYEFLCKRAGVAVEYCAEQFANDGSLTATVMKNIKRAMAGEYSRELSIKVHVGQCRIAAMGFRRGSAPGYGLRRCLVDVNGKRKTELAPGQWKSIAADRVILVPGPAQEIMTIKRIYSMFVDEGLSLNDITARLNAEGSRNAHGRVWLSTAVRDILSNEKYIGNNVFNLTTTKLRGKWRKNPPSEWVRAKQAFEPIVSRKLFQRAHQILEQNRSYSANELLDSLTAVWCQQGTLSVEALAACKYAPGPHAYQRTFGGLMHAYVLVGYQRPRLKSWAKNQKFRTAMNNEIIARVHSEGGRVKPLPGGYMLRANDELSISTCVVRLVTTDQADKRWNIGYKTHKRPDVLVVARVAELQEKLSDYYCIPYLLIGRNWLTFSDGNSARLDPFHMPSLAPLYELLAREPIQDVSEQAPASPPIAAPETQDTPGVSAWPAADVETSIVGTIIKLRAVLSDPGFAELMAAQGIATIPRLLLGPRTQQAKGYGASVLGFAIVWAFVLRLMSHAEIERHIKQAWPQFSTEMKMTYLSVLTRGPLARLPHAIVFPD